MQLACLCLLCLKAVVSALTLSYPIYVYAKSDSTPASTDTALVCVSASTYVSFECVCVCVMLNLLVILVCHRFVLCDGLAGEGWVKSMIAAGATTLAPVLGRMVPSPAAGGPRPPSASKGSTSSSKSQTVLPWQTAIGKAAFM